MNQDWKKYDINNNIKETFRIPNIANSKLNKQLQNGERERERERD